MFEHREYLDPLPAGDDSSRVSLADGTRQNKGISRADNDAVARWVSGRRRRAFQKLTAGERLELERWSRQRSSPHGLVVRSRIVLLVSEGISTAAVAATLCVAPATVRLWTGRFAEGRLPALLNEAPGRGRRSGQSSAATAAVLETTRLFANQSRTVRQVAALADTSPSTVWRIWRRFGLAPQSSVGAVDAAIAKVLAETKANAVNGAGAGRSLQLSGAHSSARVQAPGDRK
jgi:transposase